MSEAYLTPQEAAERLGVTRAALYQAIKEGRLPSVRLLGRIGIRESDLAAYTPRAYRGRRGAGHARRGTSRATAD